MRIQDATLRNRFVHGAPIYVVGSGPSMRLVDMNFLRDQQTIALNQAWKYWVGTGYRPTLALTVHPGHVSEHATAYKNQKLGDPLVPSLTWAVKKKPPMERLELDDPDHYVFHTSPDFSTIVVQPEDTLFIGRGVQQTAMDLAVRLGARTIILVGCDMTDLGGDHHGHDQHVQFHGLDAVAVYAEYRAFTRHARDLIFEQHKIPTFTLSPFVGINDAHEDYDHLVKRRNFPQLPKPKDVSQYNRKGTDKP